MKAVFFIWLILLFTPRMVWCKASDTTRLIQLVKNANAQMEKGEIDQSRETLKKALDLANELLKNANNNVVRRKAIQNKALAWKILGRLDELNGYYYLSLNSYMTVLDLEKKLGKSKSLSNAYTDIAIMYHYIGNYPEAIKNDLEALRISESIKDSTGIINAYTNLGTVYEKQGRFEDALRMHKRSLDLSLLTGDKAGVIYSWNNIGNAYGQQKKLDEALPCFEKALELAKKENDLGTIASIYMNMGNIYRFKKKFSEAGEFYTMALKLQQDFNNLGGMANVNINLAVLSLDQKKPLEAIEYSKKALAIILPTRSKEILKNAYGGLTEAYSMINDAKKSYETYKLYIAYNDSLVNEENSRASVQSQMQYEFEKQQTTDSLNNVAQTNLKNIRYNQQLKRQTMLIRIGLIGFGCMILVALLIYRANRQKRKDNLLIAEQKRQVERKQKEIIDSILYAKRIQQALLPQEKLFIRKLDKK
ncbi:MAG TPA: tetratricopeptide repeat protein [Flavobacteriales bacterium]|nr:tetratricopeptide repeat protein [Flavobacteriales bacterium]